jgi:signal peptidase II
VHALQAEGRTALAVRVWRTLLGVAWLIWLADLATKIWAVNYLSHRGSVKIVGSLFQLNFIRNAGAAFSFAPGATLLLSFFGIAVLIAIAYYAPSLTSKGWALVLGLVMGGILGNLTDRIFREPGLLRGHVIDWLQLPNWPIFNIADIAIVVAAFISVVLTARNIPPIKKEELI